MDSPSLRSLVFNKPGVVFLPLSGVLAALALPTSPSLVPGVGLLTVLVLYFRSFIPRPNAFAKALGLWLSVTIGQTVPKAGAAYHALSTPGVSFASLFLLTGFTSITALGTIFLDLRLRRRTLSPWSQALLFPTLWSTLAFTISAISPAGRLLTWSPVQGLGAYQWMLPIIGTIGIDWVMAAWAVVCSQVAETWLMGGDDIEDDGLLLAPDSPARQHAKPHPSRQASTVLCWVLIILALPSLLLNELPLPTPYPISTPLSVGCVIPSFERYKHHVPTLDDYIMESQRLTNSARVLLWPESAVQFSSEEERDKAFEKIRNNVTGSFVGVSFEEAFTLPGQNNGRSSKRTGIALISRASPEPHLMYYKRHLVPKSFSLTHSTAPPSIYTIELTHPKEVNKTDWAPAPNYTRPIPVTASICLDFADPLPFSDLNSRPALILAPARTWHLSVGFAMWQQAKRRAEELGSTLLWCDGGAGGVSGIAGQGYDQVVQVGSGSWIQNVEIQYPFDDRRTTFAYLGWFIVVLLWFITLMNSVDLLKLPFIGSFAAAQGMWNRALPQNQPQQGANLLD